MEQQEQAFVDYWCGKTVRACDLRLSDVLATCKSGAEYSAKITGTHFTYNEDLIATMVEFIKSTGGNNWLECNVTWNGIFIDLDYKVQFSLSFRDAVYLFFHGGKKYTQPANGSTVDSISPSRLGSYHKEFEAHFSANTQNGHKFSDVHFSGIPQHLIYDPQAQERALPQIGYK